MGQYIPYDKKAAEGFARALAKRKQAEARRIEEDRIWGELVAGEIARLQAIAAAPAPKPKALRAIKPRGVPAAVPDDGEKNTDTIREADMAELAKQVAEAKVVCIYWTKDAGAFIKGFDRLKNIDPDNIDPDVLLLSAKNLRQARSIWTATGRQCWRRMDLSHLLRMERQLLRMEREMARRGRG